MSGKVEYIPTPTGVYLVDKYKIDFIETFKIAEAFEKNGGSFMRKIGGALYHADSSNTIKILKTWEDEVKDYISQFIKNGNK